MSDIYQGYTAVFLAGLSDYARINAVIGTEEDCRCYITISQRMEADGSPLIVSLSACVNAFYALASGYSGVSLEGMDELAVDAVGELFNVINGHFSSRMRESGMAVTIIAPPRHFHGKAEPHTPVFRCAVESPVGTLRLMAAHEEFLAAEAH